jgi:hypothetical protein
MSRVWLEEARPRRNDHPATVDYLRDQAPYSQYNGYSKRRDLCSFGRTLQEGNRMTICSWRTQSPERPLNFVRPHAKLHGSKARYTITSFLLNRQLALCRGLKSEWVDTPTRQADDRIVILQPPEAYES